MINAMLILGGPHLRTRTGFISNKESLGREWCDLVSFRKPSFFSLALNLGGLDRAREAEDQLDSDAPFKSGASLFPSTNDVFRHLNAEHAGAVLEESALLS